MTALASEGGLVAESHAHRAAFLRFGGVCGVVGALGYLVAFLLHGDLPDQTTTSLLTFIADRPWALHHLAMILCLLLWIAALAGLAHSLTRSAAWVLGRLGVGSAMLGMTVLLWHYNIDGPALEQVADAWVASEGAGKATHLERGTILTTATSAMFPLYVALLLGLPFVLFGLAVALSGDYPAWLGWVGAMAGALAFVVGTTTFAGLDVLPMNLFVISVLVLDSWMITMGWLMWRRSAVLSVRSSR